MFILLDQLDLFLTQMQECASLCSLCDSFVSLCFFRCFLHNSVMISKFREAWIGHFLCYDNAINESFLFFNLSFLLAEFILHCFQFLGQEVILLSNLFSCHSQQLVLLLCFDQACSYFSKFFFSLVDFVHISTGFEPTLFDKL